MEFFKSKKFIWLLAFIWTAIILALSCWKYAHNLFNGLDLAIYNQAMFNTIHGRIMELSIHPNNYFGDHFEPILFLLVPFYALVQHPLTLVFLQTIMIAVTVWPIYKIAQKFLTGYWPTFMVASWLFNPFVHSASMFEFHALVFSACLLIWAIYFYKYERYLPWLITIGLVLLTREDAALSVIAFSFIALIEKKHWRWYLPTFIVAVVYFVLSMKLITYLSPDNHYKFITYYQWLGNTPKEIIINALIHPWLVLIKLFKPESLILLFFFLMPSVYVSLIKPKWLLLSLPAFLSYALTGQNNVYLILTAHYSIILLPGYFMALMEALGYLFNKFKSNRFYGRVFINLIICSGLIFTTFSLGIGKIIYNINFNDYKAFLNAANPTIDPNESVIAPYNLLCRYSGRKQAYLLDYSLTGHKQLSYGSFFIPPTNWLIIDNLDMIYYSTTHWKPWWDLIDNNLRSKTNAMSIIKLTPTTAYFSTSTTATSSYRLVEPIMFQDKNLTATLIAQTNLSDDHVFALNINCQPNNNFKIINVNGKLKNGKSYNYNLPYLWGMYLITDCQPTSTYRQLIALPKNTTSAEIKLNDTFVQAEVNSLGIFSVDPIMISTTQSTTINLN